MSLNFKLSLLICMFATPGFAEFMPQERNFDGIEVTPIAAVEPQEEGRSIRTVVAFPNGCYKPFHSFKKIEGDEIILVHLAEYDEGAICSRAIEYIEVDYSMKYLNPGKYDVINGEGGEKIAELVKQEDEVFVYQAR